MSDFNNNVKGLPNRKDLIGLAKTYLDEQRDQWAGKDAVDMVPEPTKEVLERMADDFTKAYVASTPAGVDERAVQTGMDIGAAYLRFSDDSSNPRTMNQQLGNASQKARELNIWIPWERVFCDAGIPGTTDRRNGYQMVKKLIGGPKDAIVALVVDDLSRLNRNQVDSLTLGKLAEHHDVRIVGASDGFDSSAKMSKMMHAFAAMTHESFSDQLREKVIRGERDAFNQGRNTGALPTGYKVVPMLDDEGNPIPNRKKGFQTHVVIDEEAAEVVKRIFKMYACEKISPERIARTLNNEAALERTAWSQSGIRSTLKNVRYRGDIQWGRNKSVTDPVTKKRKVVPHDKKPLRRYDESMRIIDEDLWLATEARFRHASRDTASMRGKGCSRQSQYPTRLFDLYCGYCGKPLRLYRSHGPYESMVCPNGERHAHGCNLTTSKMLRIIDEAVLCHVKEQLLADGMVESLLKKANRFLKQEAERPQVDLDELDRKITSLKTKIKRQANRLAELDDDGIAAKALVAKVRASEDEHRKLLKEREDAQTSKQAVKPLDLESLLELLVDLRSLLRDDITAAHAALAKAVGLITMTQGERIGRSTTWIAELSVDPVPVLLEVSRRRKSCPITHALEYLSVRSWTKPKPLDCTVFEVLRFHRVAKQAYELSLGGVPKKSIGQALKMCPKDVTKAIAFATSHPEEVERYADTQPIEVHPNAKYALVADAVYQLFHQGFTFTEIAAKLDISPYVAARAFDHAYAADPTTTGPRPAKPSRRNLLRLQKSYDEKIEAALGQGISIESMALQFRVPRSAIRVVRRRILRRQRYRQLTNRQRSTQPNDRRPRKR